MKQKKILIFLIIEILILIALQIRINANDDIIEGRFYIDTPTTNKFEEKSILIEGWYLSNDENASMKVYIDNNLTNAQVEQRIKREDVLEVIPGYGGRQKNPNPGFKMTLDLKQISYGNHTIKYVLVDSKGNEVVSQTKNVLIDSRSKGKFYIEAPTLVTIEGKNIKIAGWLMSNDEKANMKIYIDGVETNAKIDKRYIREDVLQAIKGYGTKVQNPKPGFEMKVDISNINYGEHTIKYVLIDEQGIEIASQTKNIIINNRVKGKFYIDAPTLRTIEGKSIKILGWLMSNDANASMKVYIDGVETNAKIEKRNTREDVLQAIVGYGTREENPNPGFEMEVDVRNISYGKHTIKYALIDEQKNEIASQEVDVNIDNKTKGTFYIDTPRVTKNTATIKTNNMQVQGWLMSNDKDVTMSILIDGVDTNSSIEKREARPDVLEAITKYDKKINPFPGFIMNIDLSSYSAGEHKLTYILKTMSNEVIAQKEITINIKRAEYYIEAPTRNTWDLRQITVSGWMMTVDKDSTFKVLINGQEIQAKSYRRTSREDVLQAILGYGGRQSNPNPGFEYKIDLSSYSKGNYDLTYRIENKDGIILAQENRQIIIDYTPKATLDIDTPNWNGVENTNGQISGWVMTNIENPTILVYIDGKLRNETQHRVERTDVLQAINGYGGKENNPKPGFVVYIDYEEFSLGNHMLKISVKDEEGNELVSKTKQFIVKQAYSLEIGSYGLSGQGRNLRYYKIGNGPNVFFATFVVHGFEDKWDHDGKELTIIAENFKDRLAYDKDKNILSKWTIYIFPEVNPDGAQAGWSNNGPGRHTLYSWAPGNQGVDLNRSWSTGYKKMTGRNYNGTAPFQAPEAAYLRDFLLNHKAENGQTVLVDLHGWTTQVIGDSGICSYYANQFPANKYTASYGSGYLINWARANLGANGIAARSALIELPSAGINNHQDVVNGNYSGRYIEATLSMLRGL